MFEKHENPLLPHRLFLNRMLKSILIGVLMLLVALFIGMYGYHRFEKMSLVDAFANASMILSGMGPFGPLHTQAGKIFAGCYALFSGLTFIAIISIILAPLIHRFLHRFHMEIKE